MLANNKEKARSFSLRALIITFRKTAKLPLHIYFFFFALVFTLPSSTFGPDDFLKTSPPPDIISSISLLINHLFIGAKLRKNYEIAEKNGEQ